MTDIHSQLHSAFMDVLERHAFMFSEPIEPVELSWGKDACCHACIAFKGPRKGTLGIVTSRPFCTQLAANVLGEEAGSISNEAAEDSLKEVLNVICGEFVKSLDEAGAVFDLSIPALETITSTEAGNVAATTEAAGFMVDDMPVLLHAEFE